MLDRHQHLTIFITVFLVGTLVSSGGYALTVNTTTNVQELQGESAEITLSLVATGVGQETESPLGTSSVRVGESVDLGELNTNTNRPAQLRVKLPDGVFYYTVRPEELESGQVDLQIDPVGSPDDLVIQERSVLVQPFPNRLMVREIVVFNNESNRRVGGVDQPITLDIPAGATRFNPGPGFGDSTDYEFGSGKLTYRVQLAPGRSILGFFYLVEPDGDRYNMVREPSWPTQQFILNTMTHEDLTITTDGLDRVSAGEQSTSSRGQSNQYVARDLSPGSTFSVTWEGLSDLEMPGAMGEGAPGEDGPPMAEQEPSPQNEESQPRPNVFSSVSWPVFIGIGISLIVFAGAYGYVQFHIKQQGGEGGDDVDFLVEEIARLDQEFEDGAVDEPFYRRTRRRWKNRAESLHDGSNRNA